ncbi:OmpA family protein [Arundinibacter roseus]|uniref:Flagellar motor protein MotB n=1 Tax=Arundinibacter roseus TaxID=2070510 RepID=A0A4R4KK41_9BACT|nr:OmpA family protein [Arundinibacter roseus]TDB66941.1 flagellar motor protein MotB [Arundinibacter roseus]
MSPLARLFFLIVFVLETLAVTAQDKVMSRRTRELYENASTAWKERKLDQALLFYEKLVELEPGLSEAHLRLGQLYEWQRKPQLTRHHYQQSIALNPNGAESATAYQWLGRDTFQRECYDSAEVYFTKALSLYPEKSNLSAVTKKWNLSAQFAQKALVRPLNITKRSLGDTVNFLEAQFFPVLTADNETLIFTGLTLQRDENMYITHRTATGWEIPKEISEKINSTDNEGTCTISADGTTLVFTACNRKDGYGGCDLYITRKEGNEWLTPKNIGDVVNSRYWESQPSLSADGTKLYFSSDRPGGQGKSDIWLSQRDPTGSWQLPQNLGPNVNTADEESAPFIHANGRTLFYASNGLPGMGGYDLFMSQQTDSSWTEPRNLGYPINTVSDQIGFYISSDGQKAYYTDDRRDAKGRRAMLYEFDIPDTLKSMFVPTNYIKGRVFDQRTNQPLMASLELYDLGTQKKVSTFTSQAETGAYLTVLNRNSAHAIYVQAEGYLFKSLTFLASDSLPSIQLDIPLEKVEKDRVEVLNNIYFATGEYALDEKSRVELSKMLDFVKANPTLKLEISGHTDDVGGDKENKELSLRRAQSVVKYLVDSGMPESRLVAVGYGETKPRVPNDSAENRQLNRRIEWRIL